MNIIQTIVVTKIIFKIKNGQLIEFLYYFHMFAHFDLMNTSTT